MDVSGRAEYKEVSEESRKERRHEETDRIGQDREG